MEDIDTTDITDIIRALRDSNVAVIDKYLKRANTSMLPFSEVGVFNPSYELIDYIINMHDTYTIGGLFGKLIKTGDINKIKYLFDNVRTNISNIRVRHQIMLNSFKIVTYAYTYTCARRHESKFKRRMISARVILSYVIEYIKDYITFEDIVEYSNIVLEIVQDDAIKYIRLDVVAYLVFKKLDSELLLHTDNIVIERLVEILIHSNASKYIINTLISYLDDHHLDVLKNAKYRIVVLITPQNYVGLLDEDI